MKKQPIQNPFCEAKIGDKKFATKVRNTYQEIIAHHSHIATYHSPKKKARTSSIRVMQLLAEQNVVLYALGFRINPDTGKLRKL